MYRKRILLLGLTVAMFVGGTLALQGGSCQTFSNSRVISLEGSLWCGGSGGGCSECVDNRIGTYCVTAGSTCRP